MERAVAYQGAARASSRCVNIFPLSGSFSFQAIDSAGELEATRPALEALIPAKADGLVWAAGVSSHSREVLARLRELPEVDVALVVVNETGAWMKDASPAEMTIAMRRLYRSGRGVYGVKALGTGQVTEPTAVASALHYAFGYRYPQALCVGISSEAETQDRRQDLAQCPSPNRSASDRVARQFCRIHSSPAPRPTAVKPSGDRVAQE